MAGFLAELKSDFQSKTPYVIWVICSGLLATTGPFGTYATVSLMGRLGYWLPTLAICVGISIVIRAFVCDGLGMKDTVAGVVLTTALICLVLCPPFYLAATLILIDRQSSAPGLSEIVLLVGSISMGMINDAELRLLRRPAPEMRGELWSITVSDHHVEVVTSKGRTNLLMRLGDAILEAEPVEGDQVHRSHWVAWSAVEGYDRDGARLFLRMKDESRVPVSRANRLKVEERLGIAAVVPEEAVSAA